MTTERDARQVPTPLVACPFCRNVPTAADLQFVSMDEEEAATIQCACGARGPVHGTDGGTDSFAAIEGAAELWNRRFDSHSALVAENERLKGALERIERELRRQGFTLAAMPAYMVREIQEWAEAALTPKAST